MKSKCLLFKCLDCNDGKSYTVTDFTKHVRREHNLSLLMDDQEYQLIHTSSDGKWITRVYDGALGHIKVKQLWCRSVEEEQAEIGRKQGRFPVDIYMGFGEFKGCRADQIPASYLHYVYTEFKRDKNTHLIFQYIDSALDALRNEYPQGSWKQKEKKKESNGHGKKKAAGSACEGKDDKAGGACDVSLQGLAAPQVG